MCPRVSARRHQGLQGTGFALRQSGPGDGRLGAATVDGLLLTTCLLSYRSLDSALFLFAAAIYVLLRDALFVRGQSVGKFFFSLLVVSLVTGRPCSRAESVRRNFLFLVPGLNVVAVILETVISVRDPQGLRLGDRLAGTQVVEGLGARELVKLLQKELLRDSDAQVGGGCR